MLIVIVTTRVRVRAARLSLRRETHRLFSLSPRRWISISLRVMPTVAPRRVLDLFQWGFLFSSTTAPDSSPEVCRRQRRIRWSTSTRWCAPGCWPVIRITSWISIISSRRRRFPVGSRATRTPRPSSIWTIEIRSLKKSESSVSISTSLHHRSLPNVFADHQKKKKKVIGF